MKRNKKNKKLQKQLASRIEHEQQMILQAETGFHITEAYKATRTNIMFSLTETGCKRIMVTSSFPGEGKTTTCINLALTFAETGAKVLFIDADMRKPTAHQRLGLNNGNGLSHLVSNFCTIEEAVQTSVRETFDVITAGHIPPNPAELLGSDKMHELLDTLATQYDYIFIDTPPLNTVTDAAVLSDKVSGVIVVVRQEVTHHKDLQEALQKLSFLDAKVLGIILNDMKIPKKGYYKRYNRYNKYQRYNQYAYRNTPDTTYSL